MPDRIALFSQTIQAAFKPIERLEYGKLCDTPGGAVMKGIPSSVRLGWSPEFPEELIPLCGPTVIGIKTHELEKLPNRPHGTTLCPVRWENREWMVMGRIGKRPEGGQDSHSYTLARYLVSRPDEMISPWSFFKTMGPLRGITEEEAKNLKPIEVELAVESLQEKLEFPETSRFLQEALIYVMSGIPVCIADPIEEDLFFAWVTALWRLMPGDLRPYLSAGWGVGASLAGKLTITHAERSTDRCAVFYRESDGRWEWDQPVEAVVHKGEKKVRESFGRNHVSAGVHYAWYLFGCQPYVELPDVELPIEPSKVNLLYTEKLPDAGASDPRPFDFEDSPLPILFSVPGLDARDKYLYERWEYYLSGQLDDEGENFAELMADFTFDDYKLQAFDLAVGAMRDARRRDRAEGVLWRFLKPADLALFDAALDGKRGVGVYRVRLLIALKGGGAVEVLHALALCARSNEAYSFPQEARLEMHHCLTPFLERIDRDNGHTHIELLNLETPPPDYFDWVRVNGFVLALGMMEWLGEKGIDICERINGITNSAEMRMLLRCAQGLLPQPPEDQRAIDSLPPMHRRRLFEQLMGRWVGFEENWAARREQLLPWLRASRIEGQSVDDPLLALDFSPERPDEHLKAIELAVEQEAVPPGLQPQVARFVLTRYHKLSRPISPDIPGWRDILRHWPAGLLAALWPEEKFAEFRQEAAGSEKVGWREAEQMVIEMGELERLIRLWANAKPGDPTLAQWYWRWMAAPVKRNNSSRTPTVSVCQFVLGKAPLSGERWSFSDVERARKLADAAGAVHALKQNAESIWRAGADPRALLALLYFFPDVDLVPTTRQLVVLQDYSRHVEKNIDGDGVHPNRPPRFRVVTLPPMELEYPGSNKVTWDDSYLDHHFWLVFRSVPIKKQRRGALAQALRFYCKDRPDEPARFREAVRDNRAEVCLKYIQAYTGMELQKAIEKVLIEFVVRWLSVHERRNAKEIRIMLLEAPMPEALEAGPFWDLLLLIRKLADRKLILKAVSEFFQSAS